MLIGLDSATEFVYAIWLDSDEHDDVLKLIGVYSSRDRAEQALARISPDALFRGRDEKLEIAKYGLNVVWWSTGFVRGE